MFNCRNEIVRRRRNSDDPATYWVVDIRERCTIRNKRVIHDRYIKIHSLGTATSAEEVKRMQAQGKRWIARSGGLQLSLDLGRRKRYLRPIKRSTVCKICSSPPLANLLSTVSETLMIVLPSHLILASQTGSTVPDRIVYTSV